MTIWSLVFIYCILNCTDISIQYVALMANKLLMHAYVYPCIITLAYSTSPAQPASVSASSQATYSLVFPHLLFTFLSTTSFFISPFSFCSNQAHL